MGVATASLNCFSALWLCQRASIIVVVGGKVRGKCGHCQPLPSPDVIGLTTRLGGIDEVSWGKMRRDVRSHIVFRALGQVSRTEAETRAKARGSSLCPQVHHHFWAFRALQPPSLPSPVPAGPSETDSSPTPNAAPSQGPACKRTRQDELPLRPATSLGVPPSSLAGSIPGGSN